MPQYVTARDYEKKIKDHMEKEKQNQSLQHKMKQIMIASAYCESDNRAHDLRKMKKIEQRMYEKETIEQEQQKLTEKEKAMKESIQEMSIAEELKRREQLKDRENSIRQRICGQNQELKELEKKIASRLFVQGKDTTN